MEELSSIKGEFTFTLFKTSNYMVCKFHSKEEELTVTGPFFEYDKFKQYKLKGEFVIHKKYGRQFNFVTFEEVLPTNEEGVITYLCSDLFKGIGKKTAKKIYNHFGENTLDLLKENPHLIEEIKLTNKQYITIIEGFESLNDLEQDTIFYLISNGFTSKMSKRIFDYYKENTLDIINENPFRPYLDVYGVSFESVVKLAKSSNIDDLERKYKAAFIIYVLRNLTFNLGDTYIEKDYLKDYCLKHNLITEFDEILLDLKNDNYIYIDVDKIYLINDYYDEKYISDFLMNFKNEYKCDNDLLIDYIKELENELNINYNDEQINAISNFFNYDFSIVTGGPGTGKTTIVKSMVSIFKKLYPFSNLIVVAPTGRAAKRINEICNVDAKTIHSLLKWNKETNTFIYNDENPILYDALIVDEFSMVDSNLFASLLKASSNIKKILIIGDAEQLPSIRPGNILVDLIKSNYFKYIVLKDNYRQAKNNEIIALCNDVLNNEINLEKYTKDVIFYDLNKDLFSIVNLIKEDLDDFYNLDDIQVLSPMYKGELGIDNLNRILQEAFNNSKIQKKVGKFTYLLNDKVIQLKNRPSDDVYNGDIGFIEDIDNKEDYMMVDFSNIKVFYENEEQDELSLAYAISVHKSQGSEYPVVYLVITRSNYIMLNKKLIYTAISRAKKKLVIISEENLLKEGILKTYRERNTTLLDRLNELC